MNFREKYEEMFCAHLDTLVDLYKKSQACAENLEVAKNSTNEVFEEIGGQIEVDVKSEDDDATFEAYISDKTKRQLQAQIDEPTQSARSEVTDMQNQITSEILHLMREDIKLEGGENNVLSAAQWCAYLEEVEATDQGLNHILENSDPNGPWGRAVVKQITSSTTWRAWEYLWRSNPSLAKEWRDVFLQNPKNNASTAAHVFTQLWGTHAVQHAIDPKATIDGQTHEQICNDLVALGAQPNWSNLPIQLFFVHLVPFPIDDVIDTTQQRFERLFALDKTSAKEVFGSLSEHKTKRSSNTNLFMDISSYGNVHTQIRNLLLNLSNYKCINFAEIDVIFCQADEYMQKMQVRNQDYQHSKSFAGAFRQVCGDLQAHDMGGIDLDRKRKM